jgi:hypothetical protein
VRPLPEVLMGDIKPQAARANQRRVTHPCVSAGELTGVVMSFIGD